MYRHNGSNRNFRRLVAGITFFLAISAHNGNAGEQPNPGSAGSPQNPAVLSGNSPGRKIYIDSATGQRSVPPIPPPVVPALTNRLSTSTEGLTEAPVTARPGGFQVHLGGRFHATVTATTNGGNGKVTTRCVSGPETTLLHEAHAGSTAEKALR